MRLLFDLPPTTLPVAGGDARFPVRRIWCVGRNYADHAKEMGFSEREAPFFFSKPADAAIPVAPGETGDIRFPPRTENYHHEIELVVAIGKSGSAISAARANEYVFGYAVGLDMTRRDLQKDLRDKGRPWEMAKAFDQSAPVGALVPAAETGVLDRGAIWLMVNDVERQRGDIGEMLWPVPEIIANLSTYVELRPGDLVFTGTPAGVGRVEKGDMLVGGVAGIGELSIRIV